MQKVAAYLLERRDDMEWPESRASEVQRLQVEVDKWLASKGASGSRPTGTYRPEDGSDGTFSIERARDGDRSWWMLQLREEKQGRRFTTSISITSGSVRVFVYIT